MLPTEPTPSPAFAGTQAIFGELLDQTTTRVSIEPWSVRLLFETGELHIEGIWRLVSPTSATWLRVLPMATPATSDPLGG